MTLEEANEYIKKKMVCTDYPKQKTFVDISGSDVNYLHVIKYAGRDKYHVSYFLCQCICGEFTIVDSYSLRHNQIKSCGCKNKEFINNEFHLTHGDSKRGNISHLYNVWSDMKYRCTNPKNYKYYRYGARGIKVCDEWLDKEHGYENFKSWALENGYKDNCKLLVKRINLNGNYCPENCIIVNKENQNKNKTHTKREDRIKDGDSRKKRHRHLYSIWSEMRYRCNNPNHASYKNYGGRGITVCPEWDNLENGYENFKKWAYENGYKDGLSIERIDVSLGYFPENCTWITMYDQQFNRQATKFGVIGRYAFPLSVWAKIVNIKESTLYSRINRYNWDIVDAILTPTDCQKGEHITEIYIPEEYMKYNKFEVLARHNKIPKNSQDLSLKIYNIRDEDIN